ncbi:hypothetical protein PHISP_07430 [Aspergillus sp. HF37]|nr:hypothetical protein PHISP_07430 [Aspergillus sp. HF37]
MRLYEMNPRIRRRDRLVHKPTAPTITPASVGGGSDVEGAEWAVLEGIGVVDDAAASVLDVADVCDVDDCSVSEDVDVVVGSISRVDVTVPITGGPITDNEGDTVDDSG